MHFYTVKDLYQILEKFMNDGMENWEIVDYQFECPFEIEQSDYYQKVYFR